VATYVFVHGAGEGAWSWELVAGALRERGHDAITVDLPSEDESAGWWEYADAVVDAVGRRDEVVVVAHSLGGFTAPLVCTRLPVDLLVLVAAMVPVPGELAGDWWTNTGYPPGGGGDDEMAVYYHDVPPELVAEAKARGRGQAAKPMGEPWPLAEWPDVPTRYLLCRDDRAFPADWLRGVVTERLGFAPDEIDGGHCAYLSRPRALAERLEAYWDELRALEFFDQEMRPHNERLRAAAAVRPGERVLDIGCGAGQTTLEAARVAGHVLGVDVSERMLERARRRAAGADNVELVLGDAQSHPFERASFDVAISRCGLMFFADPLAAFRNIAGALRPGGRLAGLIWQRYEDNEWATALRVTPEPCSLGDPEATRELLEHAGLSDVRFEPVDDPVFYGADVDAALDWAGRFAAVGEDELREILAAHATEDGVFFDARAWILTATSA
jgi:SAM-dependent methyltransferase